MIFRTARPQDHPEIFEIMFATASSINSPLLFEQLSTPKNTFVCEHDERVAAIACFISVSILGKRGSFLYALATHPNFNATVLCDLMKHAKDELILHGSAFVVTTLFSAEDETREALLENGFEPSFVFEKTEVEILPSSDDNVEFFAVAPQLLTSLRARFARGHNLTFSATAYEVFCAHWQSKNAVIAVIQEGYCVYCRLDGRVVVRELFADNVRTTRQLLFAVGGIEEVETITVHLSSDDEKTSQSDSSSYFYGMICPLNEEFAYEKLYMNMMFD